MPDVPRPAHTSLVTDLTNLLVINRENPHMGCLKSTYRSDDDLETFAIYSSVCTVTYRSIASPYISHLFSLHITYTTDLY